MAVMDNAWYGAGRCRLGFVISGKLIWCHAFDQANTPGAVLPWSRTGNLPCRHELRRAASGPTMDLRHWGMSVVVEGGFDEQRGATRCAAENIATRRPTVTFASFHAREAGDGARSHGLAGAASILRHAG